MSQRPHIKAIHHKEIGGKFIWFWIFIHRSVKWVWVSEAHASHFLSPTDVTSIPVQVDNLWIYFTTWKNKADWHPFEWRAIILGLSAHQGPGPLLTAVIHRNQGSSCSWTYCERKDGTGEEGRLVVSHDWSITTEQLNQWRSKGHTSYSTLKLDQTLTHCKNDQSRNDEGVKK